MKDKVKLFFRNNILVFTFIILSVFFELISLVFIGCKPFITRPIYAIILWVSFGGILLIMRNIKTKAVFSCLFLFFQIVINIGFIYLYDSNGTFFEWAMINQRNDAFGTIEDLSLRWGLLILLCLLLFCYIVLIIILFKAIYKKEYKIKYNKWTKLVAAVTLVACFSFVILNPVIDGVRKSKLNYVDRYLYGRSENKYQQLGITANAVYELFNGTVADSLIKHDTNGIDEFLFEGEDINLPTSEYFGISKNNNLVLMLVESFEWYVFLNNCTKEQSLALYPNLNKFLDNSVYANNFYSREKTDTAEILALLGSNPTEKYVNYDFATNSYPWSLPNMFRESVEKNGNTLKQLLSFHQNDGDFYNRNILHESLGFDELIDINDMAAYGVTNTWDEGNFVGERTKDSEVISKMKDVMFPTTENDEQYMTFWITFSMHGYYNERKTFIEEGYYDKLDEVGAYQSGEGEKADYLRTYAAAVMDLDRAVGLMMDKLEENGQLENTTIVMFSDHNTYYNNLSYYAKGITDRYDSELYRVPFMIYDTKLKNAYEENEGSNKISKFTTTADIFPTILDLFGINGYKNLYFGTSMFIKDVESIIFSRAYGIFVTDKLICYSIKNILYKSEDYSEEYLDDFIARAKIHLEKLEYLDKIFYNDYFKDVQYIYT